MGTPTLGQSVQAANRYQAATGRQIDPGVAR
jgi:hypothetical protein